MSFPAYFYQEFAGVTWRASVLIALIFALRPFLGRWLPLKILPWLWLVVAAKLLIFSAPSGWWSLYNLPSLGSSLTAMPMAAKPLSSIPSSASIAAEPIMQLPTDESWNWPLLTLLGWLAGVGVLAALQIGACFKFHHQLVREGKIISGWKTLLNECAAVTGLKNVPLLIETSLVNSPAVVGLRRPQLLVPHGLLNHLDVEEARLVFLHELSHLRRRDLWVLTFFAVVRTLHWFNPLVWLAEWALRADCEAACDAEVLSLAPSVSQRYGRTLLRLTRLSSEGQVSVFVAAISTNSNQTERRLKMIMRYQKSPRWLSLAALVLVAALGALTLPNEVTAQEQAAVESPATPASDSAIPDLNQKLKNIVVSLDFNNATIEEATKFLSIESKRLDPGHKGIDFIINHEASQSAKPVTITLNNVPLSQALSYVCQLAGVKFKGEDNNVIAILPSTADTRVPVDSEAKWILMNKLHSIVIDRVKFNKVDVATAVQFLAQKSKELDPDRQGVNFVLRLSSGKPGADPDSIALGIHREVTIALDNVPLDELLNFITQQTNLQYSVEDYAVYLRPAIDESETFWVRTYLVSSPFLEMMSRARGNSAAPASGLAPVDFKQALTNLGIRFPANAAVVFLPQSSKMVVRNTPQQLDLIANLIEQVNAPHAPPATPAPAGTTEANPTDK